MALKYFIYKEGEAIIVGLSTDIKPGAKQGFVFIEEDTNKTYTVKNEVWSESINNSYVNTQEATIDKINGATIIIQTQDIITQILLNQK